MDEDETLVEDTHFHIDHAPPEEILNVLRVLSIDQPLTNSEISETLNQIYDFNMQKDKGYSPRRLYDLGLSRKVKVKGKNGSSYCLTELGGRVQRLLASEEDLAIEIIHYLHMTGYRGLPSDRKLFWSYRKCCEMLWVSRKVLTASELASNIQSEIQVEFKEVDFTARTGYRFNSGSASQVYSWLKALKPNPVDISSKEIKYRDVQRHELALLSLNNYYVEQGYAYGDAVLLDNELIRKLAALFFISESCFYELLQTAAMATSLLKFSETLAGTSVKLMKSIDIISL